jgi:hypothetical protein
LIKHAWVDMSQTVPSIRTISSDFRPYLLQHSSDWRSFIMRFLKPIVLSDGGKLVCGVRVEIRYVEGRKQRGICNGLTKEGCNDDNKYNRQGV